MDKRNVILFFFSVFLVLVGQLLGQGPPIFVSTYTGRQILRVDRTTGAVTVIYTGTDKSRPEGLTVGPDNRVYFCDPTNGQINRMDQDGRKFEIVYDQAGKDPSKFPVGPQGSIF